LPFADMCGYREMSHWMWSMAKNDVAQLYIRLPVMLVFWMTSYCAMPAAAVR